MKDRIAKAKEYVKEHAFEIVTATASVIILRVVWKASTDARSYVNNDTENKRMFQSVIPTMIEMNRPFTYYPGIGVYWDAPLPPE
jgi:hypothetical protein